MRCFIIGSLAGSYLGEDTPGGKSHRVGTLEAFASEMRRNLALANYWQGQLASWRGEQQDWTDVIATRSAMLEGTRPAGRASTGGRLRSGAVSDQGHGSS